MLAFETLIQNEEFVSNTYPGVEKKKKNDKCNLDKKNTNRTKRDGIICPPYLIIFNPTNIAVPVAPFCSL